MEIDTYHHKCVNFVSGTFQTAPDGLLERDYLYLHMAKPTCWVIYTLIFVLVLLIPTRGRECTECAASFTSLLHLDMLETGPVFGHTEDGIVAARNYCYDLVIGRVDFFTSPNGTVVSYRLSDISVSCVATDIEYNSTAHEDSLVVGLDISNANASLALTFSVSLDDIAVPEAIHVLKDSCEKGKAAVSSHIESGVPSPVYARSKDALELAVGQEVQAFLCSFVRSELRDYVLDARSFVSSNYNASRKYAAFEPELIPGPTAKDGIFSFSKRRTVFNAASVLLGGTATDGNLVINNFIGFSKSFFADLFDNQGRLVLSSGSDTPIDISRKYHDVSTLVHGAVLSGYDSFTQFDVLRPVRIEHYNGSQSIRVRFELESLDVVTNVTSTITSRTLAPNDFNTSHNLLLEGSLHNISFDMIVSLGFNMSAFGDIPGGSLLNDSLNCILASFDTGYVSYLDVQVGGYTMPKDILGDSIAPVLNFTALAVEDLIRNSSLSIIRGLFSETIRYKADHAFEDVTRRNLNHDITCAPWEPKFIDFKSYVDFQVNPTIFLANVASAILSPQDSPVFYSIDRMIYLLAGESHNASFSGTIFDLHLPISPKSGISEASFSLADVGLINIDGIDTLEFLVPTGPQTLNSSITFGGSLNDARPLGVDTLLSFGLRGKNVEHGKGFNNVIDLRVDLTGFDFYTEIMAHVNYSRIGRITIDQFVDLTQLCLLYATDVFHTKDPHLSLDYLGVDLRCKYCDSPGMREWADIIAQDDYNDRITLFLNDIFSYLSSPSIVANLNDELDDLVVESRDSCQSRSSADVPNLKEKRHKDTTLIVIIVLSITAGLALMGYFVYRAFYSPSIRKVTMEDDFTHASQRLLSDAEDGDYARQICFVFEDESLFAHSLTPRWSAYIISFLLVAVNAIFLIANLSVGATITVPAAVLGSHVLFPEVFDFSLINTLRDMWNAGVYPLAVIIALFSGLWPYIKSCTMMYCWWSKPSSLPLEKRGRLLHWLDVLGKWSLIDVCVLVILMVSFTFHIAAPQSSLLPKQLFEGDIVVLPGLAIVFFMSAVIIQLALTHALIAIHRNQTRIGRVTEGKTAIADHAFATTGSDSFYFSPAGKWTLGSCLVFTAVLMAVAGTVDSVKFVTGGLASVFMGSDASREFSVISTAMSILDIPYGLGAFSYYVFIVFLLFIYVIPIVHALSLAALWLVPMSIKGHRDLFFASEVLFAWSALDVFLLSVVVSIYEIRQFIEFIVGDKCNVINMGLRLVQFPPVHGNYHCIDVIATLVPWSVLQVAALLMHWVFGFIMTRLAEQALHEKEVSGRLTTRSPPEGILDTNGRAFRFLRHVGFLKSSRSAHKVHFDL